MRPALFLISARYRNAFTLVELMVALSVLSLLMVVLFMIFNESTRAWSTTQKRSESFREARAALHQMARDLQKTMISSTTPFILQEGVPNISNERGVSLFFLSSQPLNAQDSADRSDLCAVGYYCAYTPNRGNERARLPRSYKLYRYFRRSNDTFTNLRDIVVNNLDAATTFFTFAASPRFTPPTITGSEPDEVLALNLCNLQVRYYDDATGDFIETRPITFSATAPAQLELSVDACNFETAALLYDVNQDTARGNWLGESAVLKNVREQNMRRFSLRVALPKAVPAT